MKAVTFGSVFRTLNYGKEVERNRDMSEASITLDRSQSQFGLADPFVSRCCSKSFTRLQGLLLLVCFVTVAAWLVSDHGILNNLLGISICIIFVGHVCLSNIKILATQQVSDPVHTVANNLSFPGLQLIIKKSEMPMMPHASTFSSMSKLEPHASTFSSVSKLESTCFHVLLDVKAGVHMLAVDRGLHMHGCNKERA